MYILHRPISAQLHAQCNDLYMHEIDCDVTMIDEWEKNGGGVKVEGSSK